MTGRIPVGLFVLATMAGLAACGAEEETPPPFIPYGIEKETLVGVFEGKFPCEDCNRLKTGLVLLQDAATGAPTTYRRREIYVGKGNTIHDTQGVWRLARGTVADSDAMVVELDPDDSDALIRYWKIDENILLLLDETLRPQVGDASHSFTLSRTR